MICTVVLFVDLCPGPHTPGPSVTAASSSVSPQPVESGGELEVGETWPVKEISAVIFISNTAYARTLLFGVVIYLWFSNCIAFFFFFTFRRVPFKFVMTHGRPLLYLKCRQAAKETFPAFVPCRVTHSVFLPISMRKWRQFGSNCGPPCRNEAALPRWSRRCLISIASTRE